MLTKYYSSTSLPTTYNNYHIPKNKSLRKIHPEITYTNILIHIINENKNFPNYKQKIQNSLDEPFSCVDKPNISLLDYLKRIIKYTKIEFSTLILSMIYLDRICKEKIFLNEFNVHRIMFISIIMAYYYNEDCIDNSKYLAKVSGISLKEMVLLEKYFIELIDFNFFVDEKIFEQYKKYFLIEIDDE